MLHEPQRIDETELGFDRTHGHASHAILSHLSQENEQHYDRPCITHAGPVAPVDFREFVVRTLLLLLHVLISMSQFVLEQLLRGHALTNTRSFGPVGAAWGWK